MVTPTDRLLIMDDDARICEVLENTSAPLGFEVKSLTDPGVFIETLKAFDPSVLIIDLKMPGLDGVQLLNRMKDVGCRAHVIVMSGLDNRVLKTAEQLGRSHGLNMLGVLKKPIKLADLEAFLLQAKGGRRAFTQQELEAAISGGELRVHYQPKITRSGEGWSISGAEALVRWQHPLHGLVMPGEFLPLAEQSGLIGPLTDQVLRTCIQQAASWLSRGLDLNVAANISAGVIGDLGFPDRLRRLLAEHELPGSRLILELTESVAMADPTRAMDIFLRVRVSDIGLAIDDFGTGFSSLKQLYQLPFDELKIDRAFVRGLPADDEARAIVQATIDMAHALKMTVCAEGVETRRALEYLASIDCDQAQGFLISPAVSAAEFDQLVGPWSAQAMRRALS